MTIETLSIVIYALLIFGVVVVQAGYSARTAGPTFGLSNRDQAQPGMGPFGHRLDKTLGNLKEGALMYLPLAILAVALNISNDWTATAALVTIVSRVLYVPVFFIGISIVRTLVWAPSFLAIPALAFGIFIGAS